jgi:chromosome segregation ATPase
MREISTPIDILDDPNAGNGELAKWILPLILPEFNARILREKQSQHLLQDNVARLAGNLQATTSNVAALGEALQTQWEALAALARGHGELTNDMRRLQALIESVVGGVADVAREQAAAHGAVQDSAQVMRTTIEALQQGQKTVQSEIEMVVDTTKQTIAALSATAAEQTAVRETVGRVMEQVTGIEAKQNALGEAAQTHEQTTTAAVTALAGRHEQLANDVRHLHELTQSVVGGVADVAREQAAARGAMQDSAHAVRMTVEALQQSQKTLQSEIEKMVDTTRQTVATVTATAAEQTAVRETVGRMMEQMTGIEAKQNALGEAAQAHEQTTTTAVTTLAGRHEQLANEVRQLHEATQSVVGSVADVTREQAAVHGALQDSTQVMRTTTEALQQGQKTLQSEIEKVVDTTRQTIATVTATAAEQTAVRETVGRVMEQVTGIEAKQNALSEAAQAREQTTTTAVTTLADRHEQLANEIRQLHELTQSVVGSVADVAREQATAHGALQDSTQVMRTTAEALQQGQKTLQTEIEKVVDTTKQTIAALSATAAEQTAVRETVGHVMEQVTGIGAKQNALGEAAQTHEQTTTAAVTALAGRHEQLANEVRQLHELTQSVVGNVADVTREQAAVHGTLQDSTQVMRTTAEALQQGQKTLQTEIEKVVDTTKQTIAALSATTAEQTAVRETVGRVMEQVTAIEAKQNALGEAAQAHEQTTTTAVTTLAGRHEQLATEVRQLHELTQSVVGGVADVAREQAGVRGALQDSTQAMRATIETLQQGQKTLQTEIEKAVDTTRQTITALTATAAEQTAGHEITRRMIGKVANAAMAALAMGHGRLTGDVPLLQASTQTVGDPSPLEAGPLGPTEEENCCQTLPAATAITHGEQIRYEVGPDRDNLGFWNNANDWAEWEVDITRPGRFKVTAEIAALASGRFEVVCADQKLAGSAPTTGDYARFQKVEIGLVELTSPGKTRVAVRPVPEGWQPMNLKSLDLVPLTQAAQFEG